jgi:hypothetical protein
LGESAPGVERFAVKQGGELVAELTRFASGDERHRRFALLDDRCGRFRPGLCVSGHR